MVVPPLCASGLPCCHSECTLAWGGGQSQAMFLELLDLVTKFLDRLTWKPCQTSEPCSWVRERQSGTPAPAPSPQQEWCQPAHLCAPGVCPARVQVSRLLALAGAGLTAQDGSWSVLIPVATAACQAQTRVSLGTQKGSVAARRQAAGSTQIHQKWEELGVLLAFLGLEVNYLSSALNFDKPPTLRRV